MNKKTSSVLMFIMCFLILLGLILIHRVSPLDGLTPLKANIKNVCLDCHPELKEELAVGKPHKPLESEECNACHSPHAARYKYLLPQIGDNLCYQCHESGKDWLKEKVVHLPVEYGECQKCHEPHVSVYSHLFRLEEKEICYQCHDRTPFQSEYIHQPIQEGRCSACHQAHSSGNAFLLTQSSPKLCFKCHPLNQKLVSKHPDFSINQVDCLMCHNPHSSTKDNLIYSLLHDPFAKNNCTACHPDTPGAIKSTLGEAKGCYKCHKEAEEKFSSKMQSHIVPGQEECTFCHNPHGAERENLVRRNDRALCIPCHKDMGQRLRVVRKDLLRHPEVIAGKCFTCHDSHASDELNFLKSNPLTLCTDCHKRQQVACHPVGEKALDPRSKTPIDCLTCHNPMEAEFPIIMRLDGSKQLCNECHKY